MTYTINTGQNRKAISPQIYGVNDYRILFNLSENFSGFRLGGNRLTAYNWENNASNAGSDYGPHSSDNDMAADLPTNQQNTPRATYQAFDQKYAGKYTLGTLQAAGYVAKDKNGNVATADKAPSYRWATIVNRKGSPLSLTPDVNDGNVYTDEFMNFLVQRQGKASSGGISAYCLDNEPALWHSTHPLVHPNKVGCQELITKNTDLAKVIKDYDNSAEVYGHVGFAFWEMLDLSGAPDWGTQGQGYTWFVDYYLDKMKAASNTYGKRLVDVYDFHWYPETKGDNRIVLAGTALTANDKAARVQAPRGLWDADYTEADNGMYQWFGSRFPLLPKLQSSIDAYYAGTKIGLSEYSYGAGDDISGGIAQADVLGIFGKYGVYSAFYWQTEGANQNYISAAFKMFRNYDGNNSTFGNTSVGSSMSDKVNSSLYSAIFGSDEGTLTLVVINKNATSSINGTFNITSGANFTSASVWGFGGNSASITARSGVSSISGNSFSYTIPAYSVLFFKLNSSAPPATRNTYGNNNNPWSIAASGTTRIEAENYDAAGQNVAYYDNTTGNSGGQYRNNDVDIETCSEGGHNVGWIANGEWLEYTVNVAQAGNYKIDARVASQSAGGNLEITFSNGSKTTGGKTFAATGGWQTWTTVSWNSVALNAGQQVMRIKMLAGNFNLNHVSLTRVTTQTSAKQIYDDAPQGGWQVGGWGGPLANGTYNINNTSPTHNNSAKSIAVQYTQAWAALSLSSSTAQSTSGYTTFRFRAYGAQSTSGYTTFRFRAYGASGGNRIQVIVKSINGGTETGRKQNITIPAGQWTDIPVYFNEVGNPATLGEIYIQDMNGAAQSTFYVDDIRLTNDSGGRLSNEPLATEPRLLVFPNPARSVVHIQLSGEPGRDWHVQVTDLLGRTVTQRRQQATGQPVSLDTVGLSPGLYVIKATDGARQLTQKVLLER
ncbi:MAG: carbohydrate-binding protein [Cytophagales bacterium]|nr:carbohydrate-binding protein [Cytophagales bacterium]